MSAPAVHRCRHCMHPMEPGRQVYCSPQCVELDDFAAARLGAQHAALQRQLDEETAAIEADIARYASERRRVLRGRSGDLETVAGQLAPLRANLEAGKAVGEIRFALQSDQPSLHGW